MQLSVIGVLQFREGTSVLDVGAGTGTLSGILSRLPGLKITAMDAAREMLTRLEKNLELQGVVAVEDFCDNIGDRHYFQAGQFDAIVSRQLVNGLFDPLAAFRSWHH